MKKKKVGIWVTLLISPIALLVVVAFIQFGVSFSLRNSCPQTVQTSSSGELSSGPALQEYDSTADLREINTAPTATRCGADTVKMVVNMISILVGVTAVLMILGAPIWIVMLVRASSYNHKLSHLPPAATPVASQPPVDSDPPHYPLVG